MSFRIALFALFSSLMASSALAHVEPGTYVGVDAAGAECRFEVIQTRFEEDFHHPLHERVETIIAGEKITLSHEAIINEAAATVRFNHGRFVGTRGFAGGSVAAFLDMEHTETSEGPTDLRVIRDHYKDNTQDSDWRCLGLKRLTTTL